MCNVPPAMDRYIFADRLERRRSRLLVLLILVLVVLATGVAAYQRDLGTGTTLVVRRAAVEHRNEDRFVAPGSEGVQVGDVIRTKRGGEAQVSYFDGSVTRVDSGTTFKVIDLVDRSDRRTIAGRLDSGRIWNSVEHYTGSGDRFEIRVPNAWVTARGTANVIDCREAPSCEVIGIAGTTEIAMDGGNTTLVGAGQCATINGSTSGCDYSREQLCEDGFTRGGLAEEGLDGQCVETPATPTPTPDATRPPAEFPTPTPTTTPEPTPSPSPTPVPSASPASSASPSSEP